MLDKRDNRYYFLILILFYFLINKVFNENNTNLFCIENIRKTRNENECIHVSVLITISRVKLKLAMLLFKIKMGKS